MGEDSNLGTRKNDHIKICLEQPVDFSEQRTSPFDFLHLEHDALPELNLNEIDTSVKFLNKKLSIPLIIGSMTGGTERAHLLNLRLAEAAQETQVGFCFGSQRKWIEDKSSRKFFEIKNKFHKIPIIFGNIGAIQLNYGIGYKNINELISATECDAFFFHLNALQESIQPEGQTNFKGLINKIKIVSEKIGVPLFFKEVGSGFSQTTLNKIKKSKIKFDGLEVAGTGGTSWSLVESYRTQNVEKKRLGKLFANWGESTVESIINARETFPNKKVISSGGVRNGIHLAKSIAIGADIAAIALPFIKAAEISTKAVIDEINKVKSELKLVQFLTGSENIQKLKNSSGRITNAQHVGSGAHGNGCC